MEPERYVSLGDSYIQIEGVEKEGLQFLVDFLNGKKEGNITKSLPQFSGKINEKS